MSGWTFVCSTSCHSITLGPNLNVGPSTTRSHAVGSGLRPVEAAGPWKTGGVCLTPPFRHHQVNPEMSSTWNLKTFSCESTNVCSGCAAVENIVSV